VYSFAAALFAQDEMQVAEHPILGSVREQLLAMASSDAKVSPDDSGCSAGVMRVSDHRNWILTLHGLFVWWVCLLCSLCSGLP